MTQMPVGLITLVVISILIFFGIGQRILDRMRLNDKAALLFILAMFVGTFIPNIPITADVSINVGGGIIPIALCAYLLAKAGTAKERIRAIVASIVAAAVIYGATKLLPAEPTSMIVDPNYMYAIIAGLTGYIAGRSRRSAFIAAVLGIIINDIIYAFEVNALGINANTAIGGAGVFDSVVLAGILAVALAELVGETRERLQGGPAEITKDRPQGLKGVKATSSIMSVKNPDKEDTKDE